MHFGFIGCERLLFKIGDFFGKDFKSDIFEI